MNRFVLPAAASIVVGLLLGAAAVFGVTLMVQQDTKPPLPTTVPAAVPSKETISAPAGNENEAAD